MPRSVQAEGQVTLKVSIQPGPWNGGHRPHRGRRALLEVARKDGAALATRTASSGGPFRILSATKAWVCAEGTPARRTPETRPRRALHLPGGGHAVSPTSARRSSGIRSAKSATCARDSRAGGSSGSAASTSGGTHLCRRGGEEVGEHGRAITLRGLARGEHMGEGGGPAHRAEVRARNSPPRRPRHCRGRSLARGR